MGGSGFLPYGRQLIEQDDIDAVVSVLKSDFLTTGPAVARFEESLAAEVGAKWAVAVSHGTAALHAACFAARVREGDCVVVPAVTFLATANCARYLNAEPVFADVDPDTGLIDPGSVEKLIDERTKAILPVHLTGQVANLEPLQALAKRSGAMLIEDAAHALGATHEDRAVGSCTDSDMAIFSFHPVKQITTGEGGAITGNDETLKKLLLSFRNHCMLKAESDLESKAPGPWYYEQQELGHNFRLSDLQAALGESQLKKLRRFTDKRRHLAARYDELLDQVDGVRPVTTENGGSAYHLYSVLIDFEALHVDRSDLMVWLRERGIGTQVHYIPLPAQPYYKKRGWRLDDFPGAKGYYARTLSLPLFVTMEASDVERVVSALRDALTELGRS